MNAKQLAQLAIQVLDAQQTYFRTRTKDDLVASKRLEGKLRTACEFVLQHSREAV